MKKAHKKAKKQKKEIVLDEDKLETLLSKLEKNDSTEDNEEKFKTTLDKNRFTEEQPVQQSESPREEIVPIRDLEDDLARITVSNRPNESSSEQIDYTKNYSSGPELDYETGERVSTSAELMTPQHLRTLDIENTSFYFSDSSNFSNMFPTIQTERRRSLTDIPSIQSSDPRDYFSSQPKSKSSTKNPFFEEQEDKYNTVQ